MALATRPESAERTRVPASAEVRTYEEGLKAGRKEAEGKKEKKGFLTSLLDDLLKAIEDSDERKREQLTARTKTPTMETVVEAFDAAHDVTTGNVEAYRAYRAGDKDRAAKLQQEALDAFMALDPLVREGAIFVLYVQAEAEYAEHQLHAAQHRADLDAMSATPASGRDKYTLAA